LFGEGRADRRLRADEKAIRAQSTILM